MSLGLDDLKKSRAKKAKPKATKSSAAKKAKKTPAARPWSPTGLTKNTAKKIHFETRDERADAGLYDMDETLARSTGTIEDSNSIVHRILEFFYKAESFIREKRSTLCGIRSRFVNRRGQ